MVLLGLVQRLFGISDRLDHMDAFAQAGVEVMAKQGFVLDHQQFHVQLLMCIACTGLFAGMPAPTAIAQSLKRVQHPHKPKVLHSFSGLCSTCGSGRAREGRYRITRLVRQNL